MEKIIQIAVAPAGYSPEYGSWVETLFALTEYGNVYQKVMKEGEDWKLVPLQAEIKKKV